jgi:pimeloyl-ACP methyl ester carboxylesterase
MVTWCSWCFEKTSHRLVEQNYVRRNTRRCSKCANITVKCRYCANMARAGKTWDDECCAVHDGTIRSFSALALRIRDLSEWRRVVPAPEGRNMVRVGKVVGGAATVAVAATGAGIVMAPALGGALGSLAGLSGAAASSHGLAVLGGGALSAGGFGMAGGTVLISVGAGLFGASGGGVLVNKYVSEVNGFDVHRCKDGAGPDIVVVNGFLTESERHIEHWTPALRKHFQRNSWYELAWESKQLRDLSNIAYATRAGLLKAAERAARAATRKAGGKLAPMAWLSTALEVGGNPWWVAIGKARQTGQILADLILRTRGSREQVLIGHSLGARVIFFALQALAESGKPSRVKEVHLFGGAVGSAPHAWRGPALAVKGRIYNYYSLNDDVLRVLYRVGMLFQSDPIGRHRIEIGPKVRNVDVTSWVAGHSDYKSAAARVLYGRARKASRPKSTKA